MSCDSGGAGGVGRIVTTSEGISDCDCGCDCDCDAALGGGGGWPPDGARGETGMVMRSDSSGDTGVGVGLAEGVGDAPSGLGLPVAAAWKSKVK